MLVVVHEDGQLYALATRAGEWLDARGARVALAESCTGGWVAKAITDVPGSSGWFECGWVVYSDAAKVALLGVGPETLAAHGAVSEPVVREMAVGALHRSGARYAIAVSGIAGPGGGSADKPAGTVCIAWANGGAAGARAQVDAVTRRFEGDRDAVRRQAAAAALDGLMR